MAAQAQLLRHCWHQAVTMAAMTATILVGLTDSPCTACFGLFGVMTIHFFILVCVGPQLTVHNERLAEGAQSPPAPKREGALIVHSTLYLGRRPWYVFVGDRELRRRRAKNLKRNCVGGVPSRRRAKNLRRRRAKKRATRSAKQREAGVSMLDGWEARWLELSPEFESMLDLILRGGAPFCCRWCS